ncbi:UNVERIFIED_CONTAM: hypothetical protein FKN15_076566 [Acipenser sinensis]
MVRLFILQRRSKSSAVQFFVWFYVTDSFIVFLISMAVSVPNDAPGLLEHFNDVNSSVTAIVPVVVTIVVVVIIIIISCCTCSCCCLYKMRKGSPRLGMEARPYPPAQLGYNPNQPNCNLSGAVYNPDQPAYNPAYNPAQPAYNPAYMDPHKPGH